MVQNPGSERNLISICLKNNDKIVEVESNEIFAEHFSVAGHKYIFMAMMYLYSKSIRPNPMSIMEVLSSKVARSAVEELGGIEYLTILEEASIPTDNLNIFIKKIKQAHTRRMLMRISDDVKSFVASDKAEVLNPSELVSYAEQQLNDLSVSTIVTDNVYKMGDKTEEILKQRSENPSQVAGLEVGFPMYDVYTNGAQPGDLIIICAPSKVGKSVLLTNWATKLSIFDKIPIVYFDSEMNEREQEDRLLSNISGVPHSEVVNGMFVLDTVNGNAVDKINALNRAREMLQAGSYYHVYMPYFSIEKVTALSRKFAMQYGIKAVFFDYIKVPSNQADFKSMQEYQALGFFTSGLKDLAGTLRIPIVSACQTNRNDLDTEDPDASNIGGSYRILQLASKVSFLINKSREKIAKDGFQNGNQQLIVKYQRNGGSDCDPINVMFNKTIMRQSEV